MKQFTKAIAIILVLMLSVTILAGCGGTKLEGKFSKVSEEYNGEKQLIADIANEMKAMYEGLEQEIPEGALDDYIEFLADGKCKVTSVYVGAEIYDGTFKIDGKNLEVSFEGETLKGTIDGKVITFTEEDEEYGNMIHIYEKK